MAQRCQEVGHPWIAWVGNKDGKSFCGRILGEWGGVIEEWGPGGNLQVKGRRWGWGPSRKGIEAEKRSGAPGGEKW